MRTDVAVAVVGAGLAGLNTARLLCGAGVDVEVFEARNRIGGRALTMYPAGIPGVDGFDLGPSWVWPAAQPGIAAFIAGLGLDLYAQSSDGDVVFERMSREPAQRYPSVATQPARPAQTMRIAGGTAALIRAVTGAIPPGRIHTDTPVTALALDQHGVALTLNPPRQPRDPRRACGSGGAAPARAGHH